MGALKRDITFFSVAAVGLTTGAILHQLGRSNLAESIWELAAVPATAMLAWDVVRLAMRRQVGVDILALVAISAALGLNENLTAVVIAVMYTSGHTLESYAQARAGREMTALLAHAPRVAWRVEGDKLLKVELSSVRAGDRLMVKTGEIVPVDGRVQSAATLDESVLTGESSLLERRKGDLVRSGAINAGVPFNIIADDTAEHSTYAGVVKLVTEARLTRAPATRLADKAAIWFVPLALSWSLIAWYWSGNPSFALAVLVVATPCPLILAVPIALVCGMSNCAKRGILVKGGGALEALAQARVLFFDKTGTLTGGRARIARIETAAGTDKSELLRMAASLEQMSTHISATVIVSTAQGRSLRLSLPTSVKEQYGAGLTGIVDGVPIAVGTPHFVLQDHAPPSWAADFLRQVSAEGGGAVFVARGSELLGALHLSDPVRIETPRALRLLRRAGIARMVMLTGDSKEVANSIGTALGVDEIFAELDPAGKVAAVADVAPGTITVMVGDGVNDAPALASASVGVAMGAHGAAASAEAADVVLLVDRLDRLAEGIYMAKAARRIALQSVTLGMGMSLVAMTYAALGYLPPAYGAALQELIDVLAIANALRASGVAPSHGRHKGLAAGVVERLAAEHEALLPLLDRVEMVADELLTMPLSSVVPALRALDAMIDEQLVAHEKADESSVYPAVVNALGGDDPLAPMSRVHREIFSLAHQLHLAIGSLDPIGAGEPGLRRIQRLLYGLETIMRLHFAQEEEIYMSIA